MDQGLIMQLAVPVTIVTLVGTGAWILVTWLKIRHGYPLLDVWGKAVYPKKSGDEMVERIRLLSQENAQLRAEIGSVKDRLETLERIATDPAERTARAIEDLRRTGGMQ
ncbi:hypothetical protein [Sphingomonas sp. DT-204]|uniref:hypothetical protein n=1 Tax=Sphingomonas sp. DT-204 TaxID=3396166 RepID=UPI003F19A8D6